MKRLAVVGAGQFGKNHCRVIHESARAELRAVVDTDAARTAEAAQLYGAEPLSDARDQAEKLIRDLYSKDFHDASQRLPLAHKLIERAGQTTDNLAARYQLIIDARDLAADAALKIQYTGAELPPARKAGVKVKSVAELVTKLKTEAKVL